MTGIIAPEDCSQGHFFLSGMMCCSPWSNLERASYYRSTENGNSGVILGKKKSLNLFVVTNVNQSLLSPNKNIYCNLLDMLYCLINIFCDYKFSSMTTIKTVGWFKISLKHLHFRSKLVIYFFSAAFKSHKSIHNDTKGKEKTGILLATWTFLFPSISVI